MEIVVQKYGGNLVKDKDSLLIVAKNIIKTYNNGKKVVVVVSAQGNTTNELTNKINEITTSPNKREADVILSSGEQITAGLLSIILNNMGYPCVSYNGSQACVYTDDNYTNSNIIYIDTDHIKKSLYESKIVIVTGFQGVDLNGNITTLGRGGSDTTATFLAGFLEADYCEIFKDTKYIYTADPKVVKTAVILKHLNYDQMFLLSNSGAKVLCDKCINFAKKKNVKIVIKSVDTGNIGTIISDDYCDSNLKIIGITKKSISDVLEKISIVVNDSVFSVDEAEKTISNFLNNNNYKIEKNNSIVSVIVDKSISEIILIKLHNLFING